MPGVAFKEADDGVVKTLLCSETSSRIDACELGSDVCMDYEESSEGQTECFRAVCELLEHLIRENDCHQV
jgi:hypothetical protein